MYSITLLTAFASLFSLAIAAPALRDNNNGLGARESFNTSTICLSSANRNAANWNASGTWDYFYILADEDGPPAGSTDNPSTGYPTGVSWTRSVFDMMEAVVPNTIGFTCTPGNCVINIDQATCVNYPMPTFVLYNMVNFNDYLYQLGQTILDTQQIIDGFSGSMVETFTDLNSNSDSSELSNGISLATAILGAIGMFIPELGDATDDASTILGLFSALLGMTADSVDDGQLEFNDFAGATALLAKITEVAVDSIYNYANSTLNTPPQSKSSNWDYSNDPESLVQIFWDGAFAAPITNIEPVDGSIVSFLASPVINYLWATQDTFIVTMSNNITSNVCHSGLYTGQSYCDSSDVLHVLLQWDVSQVSAYDGRNFGEELDVSKMTQVQGYNNLTDYGLTIRDVEASSSHWQSLYGYSGSVNSSDMISALTSSLNPNLSELYYFTLPVCDLDSLWTTENAKTFDDCFAGDPTDLLEDCLSQAVVMLCCSQKVHNTKWPWSPPSSFTCGDYASTIFV